MISRTAPRPPGTAHPVHAGAHLRDRIGRRRGQAAARQHRQVEQVVAHVGDSVLGQPCILEHLVEGPRLVRDALHRRCRTPSSAARCAVAPEDRADSRPTGRPARWAQTIAAPSLDVKALRFAAVGVHAPRCRQSARRRRRRAAARAAPAPAVVLSPGGIRPSASARGRAGARRPPRPPAASTTTTDVILRVSIIFSASTASSSPTIVTGCRVITSSAVSREQVRASASSAGASRRR